MNKMEIVFYTLDAQYFWITCFSKYNILFLKYPKG